MRIEPIEMNVEGLKRSERLSIPVGSLSGVRHASRNVEAMREELDQMIERNKHFSSATRTNPSIFRLGRYLLTQGHEFEVQGPLTGGEAEVVVIRMGGELYVTVGSDQCDRELDPLYPDKPKQMCPHPIARNGWYYEDVRDHWDRLHLYSHVVVDNYTIPLQDAELSELVSLDYLLKMDQVTALTDPMVLFCGAVPFLESAGDLIEQYQVPKSALDGVGDEFLVRLHDPELQRTIEHRYRAHSLGDDLDERKEEIGLAMYSPNAPA
jgi:hypothetical protein